MKKITAREAFDSGLKRYFTGEPCKYGHIDERMISNGRCLKCLTLSNSKNKKEAYQRVKEWRKNNPGARTEEARRYRKKHPDKVKENSRRYIKNNIELVRERDKLGQRRLRALYPEREKERLKRFYDKKEAERIKAAGRPRPSLCEICGTDEFRIVFDHCHMNGHFRGWICDRCNRVLGCVKDSVDLLGKMSAYLESRNGCKETEVTT